MSIFASFQTGATRGEAFDWLEQGPIGAPTLYLETGVEALKQSSI